MGKFARMDKFSKIFNTTTVVLTLPGLYVLLHFNAFTLFSKDGEVKVKMKLRFSAPSAGIAEIEQT